MKSPNCFFQQQTPNLPWGNFSLNGVAQQGNELNRDSSGDQHGPYAAVSIDKKIIDKKIGPSQLTTDHLSIAEADHELEHTQSSAHRSLGCLL